MPGEVRKHIVEALTADLVGPYRAVADGELGEEEALRIAPTRWYLTGFLAPPLASDVAKLDVTADDQLPKGSDTNSDDASPDEGTIKQKQHLPSSIGLSVLLPPGPVTDEIEVTLSWAEYHRVKVESDGRGKSKANIWQRSRPMRVVMRVALDPTNVESKIPLRDHTGLLLTGKLRAAGGSKAGKDNRALTLFFVNQRTLTDKDKPDEATLFQVKMELAFERGILPRENTRGANSDDWDDRVSDLQFRNVFEYAVGHGVSAEVPAGQERVTQVATTWLPSHEVPRVETSNIEGAERRMEILAQLADEAAVNAALSAIPRAYETWIQQERLRDVGDRGETRDRLLQLATAARTRIEEGIRLLAKDPQARDAFCTANRAMAMAARKQRNVEPEWRLFQLAFILLNLPGIVDERSPQREQVELIFFPTGGGKTEAYLGVIAFTLLLRRMRGQSRPDRGLGVAVLLRYTLRLLTLDQLGRAATLICALELVRRERVALLGVERFTIGLWVGKSATANTLDEVKGQLEAYLTRTSETGSPFPLPTCPWCRTKETPAMKLAYEGKKPIGVSVSCANFRDCEFSNATNPDGLPVLFVDEQIYRELPCFVIATVDKFAMLPWRGETGMLFGRVSSRTGGRFFGPMDGKAHGTDTLTKGLLPPELIVQDELHLISGPLGTMVGLYETAIEFLCCRTLADGTKVLPKILASTATVRRAEAQVQALFGRRQTALFPPQGIDPNENFFAHVDTKKPGRLYIGVAASGRSMKVILLRAYVTLLAAANAKYDAAGPANQEADAYMTLAGYFNSLRELGGMRRLVEDEVGSRTLQIEDRIPMNVSGKHVWFKKRNIRSSPVELTSRESSDKIKAAKARLEQPWAEEKSRVDVLLASNMISVGVDIDRLGVMVVAGQPKTTSEYIQASSRVGRKAEWPGLVVTCFNMHKPRDRSHYERFAQYHASFYRFVEAQSLTPFAGPALDRGLAGTLLAMMRLGDAPLTPPSGAMELIAERTAANACVAAMAERAGSSSVQDRAESTELKRSVQARGNAFLDAWEQVINESRSGGRGRQYSRFDRSKEDAKPIMFTALEIDTEARTEHEQRFQAATSMRDVEPAAPLWLVRGSFGKKSAND
jgi:hypothetical protein